MESANTSASEVLSLSKNNEKDVLILFVSNVCLVCKHVLPLFEKWSKQHPSQPCYIVSSKHDRVAFRKYGIRLVPSLRKFKASEKHQIAHPVELKEFLMLEAADSSSHHARSSSSLLPQRTLDEHQRLLPRTFRRLLQTHQMRRTNVAGILRGVIARSLPTVALKKG